MKRAVVIGIDYKNTKNELNGCIKDSERMVSFLLNNGWEKENILHITDLSLLKPTKNIILKSFEWLLNDKKENEFWSSYKNFELENLCSIFSLFKSFYNNKILNNKLLNNNNNEHKKRENNKQKRILFFHFSGHGISLDTGVQIPDKNDEEIDGLDECLCPLEINSENDLITDDEIKKELIIKGNENDKIFICADCCHSGTLSDLKYYFNSSMAADQNDKLKQEYNNNEKILCKSIMLSGCEDDDYSNELIIEKIPSGVLTHCLIELLNSENKNLDFLKFILKLRNNMKKYSNQKPCINFSHKELIESNNTTSGFKEYLNLF